MIKARYLWIPVIVMALVACAMPHQAVCAAEGELPDEAAVRAAINTMFADPFSERAVEAQKSVLDFSQGSDKIKVIVARDIGFYPGTKYSDMLLAHYIAGVVKFGLENTGEASDERLGTQAGLRAALSLYKKIRVREASFTVPELNVAEASIQNGRLSVFIDEALARAKKERGAAK